MINRFIRTSLTGLMMTVGLQAMYPQCNSYGWLVLVKEGEAAPHTKAKAVTSGVETWYREWRMYIEGFVDFGEYNAYLPGSDCSLSFQHVDARTLAELIYNDCTLELYDVPGQVIDEIEDKLNQDRYHSECGWEPRCGRPYPSYIDPIGDWKWRSAYMEDMYSFNSDSRSRCANCYGTADYLAKDYEWVDGYEQMKQNCASEGYDLYGLPFVQIFGWGYGGTWENCIRQHEICIDDDLDPDENARAELVGHHAYYDTPNGRPPEQTYMNTFDVVRYSASHTPGYPSCKELIVDSDSLGTASHAAVFICKDETGEWWSFEKADNDMAPYRLKTIGALPGYETPLYRSYFKKYGYNKENLADSWDYNWANVTP